MSFVIARCGSSLHGWRNTSACRSISKQLQDSVAWKSDPQKDIALESLQTFFKSPEWKANVEDFRDCAKNDEKLRKLEQR